MFKRLKHHWKVDNIGLVLILCTFAVTGTLTAWLSRKVSEWLSLDKYSFAWWTSKVVVLFFGYQVIILIIGFCFGKFSFFWNYEKKILRRFGLMTREEATSHELQGKNNRQQATGTRQVTRICIFASGTGTNAQKIIDHFRQHEFIKVALIACNNSSAGVLKIAENEKIPVLIIERKKFYEDGYLQELKKYEINFIVLAGFLWKLPPAVTRSYPDKIINIHPALLPNYGGKGMYGSKVHEAVINAGEKQSGITIHYVDDIYDNGKIIFQSECTVREDETPESLAGKIHVLEHKYYPKVIEDVISNSLN